MRTELKNKKIYLKIFLVKFFKQKDIKERIKTFEDACKKLGKNH